MPDALVGVDVGTTGVKAVALSPTGDVVARAEEEYALSLPQPGWAEQDPEDWVRAAERALLAAFALWSLPYLRWPAAFVSTLIIISTVTTGWHYAADVAGGVSQRTLGARFGDVGR